MFQCDPTMKQEARTQIWAYLLKRTFLSYMLTLTHSIWELMKKLHQAHGISKSECVNLDISKRLKNQRNLLRQSRFHKSSVKMKLSKIMMNPTRKKKCRRKLKRPKMSSKCWMKIKKNSLKNRQALVFLKIITYTMKDISKPRSGLTMKEKTRIISMM